MSAFEKWYLPLLIAQTLILAATFGVASSALNDWRKQIDYGRQRAVLDKLQRLCDECRILFGEARDRDFFFRQDHLGHGFKFSNNEEEMLFWALYSPYFILNSGSATFSDLSQAAIEAKSILTLDIIDDVKEIKNTRNLIMNSSIKLTWIRFGGGVSSDTLSQEMEMYEQIIFSTPGDEFELRVSERINQIERKVKDIKTDQY